MPRFREVIWRVLAVLRRRRLDGETREEMRFHLDMEVEAAMRRGLSRREAEREARLRAGSIPAALEQVRDERGLGWLDGSLADLRHAAIALRRQPGFAMVVCGALALAVAMNTLIFAVVDGVLLRPLPYPEPDRLVRVFDWSTRNPHWPPSIGNYLEYRRENRTLAAIGLYTREDMQLMHGDRPERLVAVRVTDDFFPTLGVLPMLGHNFSRDDVRQSARVVILSYPVWSTRFHQDPRIVGKSIRLDREPWTVIGVMPSGFQHVGGSYRSPLQGDTVAIWRPLALDLPQQAVRFWHFTNAIARLKPGVTGQQASDDLNRIMQDLGRRFPDTNGGVRADLVPLANEVTDSSRATVRMLTAAGGLVLLIACVNVAGLCVARALARRRELAIRQALGARSWRLVRAVLSENVITGSIGGGAGALLAGALIPVMRAMMPADFPRLHEVHLSAAAAAFALAAALAASIVAGLVPALRQTRQDARDGLSEDNRASATRGTRRLRGVLVVVEVALACLLCVGTVLLMRSSMMLAARDHGFSADRVLTFSLSLPAGSYNKPEPVVRLFDELARRWKQLPGVRAVGLTSNLPWTGYDENTSFDLIGRPVPPGDSPQARFQAATPGFFTALRLHLIRGRLFDERDRLKSPPVVIVNEALARRFFDGANPTGQRLNIWGTTCEIAGVVADIRDNPAAANAEPAFWWPLAQQPFTNVRVVMGTNADPLALVSPAAAVLRDLERELPMAEVRTMADVAAEALGERRFALWLFQAFSVLALALASFGIYGMLSYGVHQRRRELGVRMALGATRARVVWMIVSDASLLCAAGIVLGLATAPLATRALSAMLFGVAGGDIPSLVIAPLLIVVFALAASIAPAWHASRAEAVAALREQ